MGSRQGIQGAECNATTPFTLGLVNLFSRAGTPIAYVTALHVGDICIDSTNGAVYIAGATGSAGWIRIGGKDVEIVSFAGIAASLTPTTKGGIGVDTTNGKLYVAGGVSASTDWKLVTSA